MALRSEVPAGRILNVGGPLHLLEWDGPPETTFVCVHGLGGSHANWLPVAPALARRGRVLVPDLPGFGLTPRAGRRSSLPALRDTLSRLIHAEATGRVILLGNSMGGAIALAQAAYEPGSAAGVVLTGGAVQPAPGGRPSALALASFGAYATPGLGEVAARMRTRGLPGGLAVRVGLRVLTVDPSRIDPDVVEAHRRVFVERAGDPDAGAAFLESARSLLALLRRPQRYGAISDRVAAPVLLIHGARDLFVPAAWARAAAEARPAWTLRALGDVGHVPHLEAPDRWLFEVESWLERTIAPGA